MRLLISHRNGVPGEGRIPTRSFDWTTPVRGVRVPGDVRLTHRLITLAAVASSDRLAVACDLTAAHFWSMVVPSGFGLQIDAQACAIATVRDGSRHRSGGLRGRRLLLPPEHITSLEGIPITTPARTWLDCSALVSYTDTVAMGDAMLRGDLATLDDLRKIVVWGRGRRGVRNARFAAAVLDAASESPGESWVRAMLVRQGVPRPHCNHEVEVAGFRFRLDMAWPDSKIAVEYDGQDHHGPGRQEHDEWRRSLLRADGWTVIVVRKDDLAHIDDVAQTVSAALRRAQ